MIWIYVCALMRLIVRNNIKQMLAINLCSFKASQTFKERIYCRYNAGLHLR